MDSLGVVTAGSTRYITVTALVRPKAGGRATTAQDGDGATPAGDWFTLAPEPTRLYVGQSHAYMVGTPYSADERHRRYDQVSWVSDRPAVGCGFGRWTVTAGQPGQGRHSHGRSGHPAARAPGGAEPGNPGGARAGSAPEVRAGDVIKFRFVARAATACCSTMSGVRSSSSTMSWWA